MNPQEVTEELEHPEPSDRRHLRRLPPGIAFRREQKPANARANAMRRPVGSEEQREIEDSNP
jgi:hypothetical protein